jgi:DNA polymerase I
VRGDWSEIAREVQEDVLRAILKLKSTEMAIVSVRETVRRLREGQFPMEAFIIRKALTKPIEEYRVRTPHVEVARKLAEEGWEITVGDKVAYVIVKGKGALFQKARPYRRVKPEDLDLEYYVENQVKPAAMRLLEGFGVTQRQLGV